MAKILFMGFNQYMIGITPYLLNPQINYNKKQNLKYKNVLAKDTVSFGSKNILMYSGSKMNEIINGIIIPKNFLGNGTQGNVYKIPFTDFCIKIPHMAKCNFENFSTLVSEKDKINHIVAIFSNGAQLMKTIEGTSLMFRRNPILRFSSENKKHDVFLEKFLSDNPEVQIYDFLKQLAKAKKHGMYFDFSPGNIIYNKKNNTLTAIDFYEKDSQQEVYNYSVLSRAFLGIKTYLKTPEAIMQNKNLGLKFIKIGVEDLTGKNELHLSKTDFEVFFERFEQSQPEENIPPQYKFLKQSVLELFESEDSIISESKIQGKLKYINCIINQMEKNIT